MRFLTTIFAFTSLLFGADNIYSEANIAKELKDASKKYGIDSKVLYTLAKIESNFNPLIISFTTKNPKQYNFANFKKTTSKYGKNKYIVSFSTKDTTKIEELKQALRILIRLNLKVDAGLMQINSVNFTDNEIDKIFEPRYNIKKSLKVLKYCIASKKQTKHAIECYNKGNQKVKKYNYYARFLKSYLRDFSTSM